MHYYIFRTLVLFLIIMGGQHSAGAAEHLIPVEDFFRNPRMHSIRISPDGKHLAAVVPAPNLENRMALAIASIDKPQNFRIVAHFDDADVGSAEWVNSKRLIFSAADLKTELGNAALGGLYAVDLNSENFIWLVARRPGEQDDQPIHRRPLRMNHSLFQLLPAETDDVLLTRFELRERESQPSSTTPVRLNTRTKAQVDLLNGKIPPEGIQQWVLSTESEPHPVAGLSIVNGQANFYSFDKNRNWKSVATFGAFDGGGKSMSPAWTNSEGQLFVIAGQNNDEQTTALFRLNTESGTLEGSSILSLKGFDVDTASPVRERQTGQILGVQFLTDARGTVWYHSTMRTLQSKVDSLLPATVNLLTCDACLSGRHLVVTAYSDQQSPIYFLFDKQTAALTLIGASRPWLSAKEMAKRDFVEIIARDGVKFPVHITKPKGTGPWPTVVLVHGGPYVRGGEWAWEGSSQFLASRGYLVIEPEFRGSTGFGFRHFRAGWKQWGLTMQDDVTDATHWATLKGLADPKRIAIAGASYGGYATMMALVKEPELYRAGINWVGVTDISLMYNIGWSDFAGGEWMRYGMPALIGDPDKDRDQLRQTSPLERANQIVRPVLMAYGGKDLRVPLPHGEKMREALRKSGNSEVQWIEYPEEGHGWLLESNRYDFWMRVERFLSKHLQPQ